MTGWEPPAGIEPATHGLGNRCSIDWARTLHVGSASHLVRGNLSRLEESLEPFGFIRVHRRFLVNLDRVIEVQPWFGGDAVLVLASGAKVRLSRTFKTPFEGRFLSL